ncbi:MAG TPA: LysR family transcriptional regulator [Gemmatimonadaceae bacterium]|jgi:DNA-binding transcriptional LysR family regulator|nr:LysR family transcriptional regulator [Gemmatimonadaceae bacterium]
MLADVTHNGALLIKHLEYLSALSREKHFARAAAACQVTQPTLSAGIKHLEETLGVLIVERGQRFRGLTPEGERVLAWAQRILADVQSLKQDVSESRGGLTGRLKLGVVPAALPMVALVTTPFADRYPETTTTVLSLSSKEIQRGLDDFDLDVGLTYLDNEPLVRVRTVPLYRERYLLVTPNDGPFTGRKTVTWREASTLRLALLTPDMQNRRIIDTHFTEAGVTARPQIETNAIVTLESQLRLGSFSSVLPATAMTLLGNIPGMCSLPLVEPEPTHAVGLIVPDRDPMTPIVSALLQITSPAYVAGAIDRAAGVYHD